MTIPEGKHPCQEPTIEQVAESHLDFFVKAIANPKIGDPLTSYIQAHLIPAIQDLLTTVILFRTLVKNEKLNDPFSTWALPPGSWHPPDGFFPATVQIRQVLSRYDVEKGAWLEIQASDWTVDVWHQFIAAIRKVYEHEMRLLYGWKQGVNPEDAVVDDDDDEEMTRSFEKEVEEMGAEVKREMGLSPEVSFVLEVPSVVGELMSEGNKVEGSLGDLKGEVREERTSVELEIREH